MSEPEGEPGASASNCVAFCTIFLLGSKLFACFLSSPVQQTNKNNKEKEKTANIHGRKNWKKNLFTLAGDERERHKLQFLNFAKILRSLKNQNFIPSCLAIIPNVYLHCKCTVFVSDFSLYVSYVRLSTRNLAAFEILYVIMSVCVATMRHPRRCTKVRERQRTKCSRVRKFWWLQK